MVQGDGCAVSVHCGQSEGLADPGLVVPEPDAVVTSFGFLHGGPPVGAVVVVDVRVALRDPGVDPGLRELTGRDDAVVARVLATPGARGVIDGVARIASALLGGCGGQRRGGGPAVRVAVGCAGGRHRSVVIAEEVALSLAPWWAVRVEHLHLDRGVVCGGGGS